MVTAGNSVIPLPGTLYAHEDRAHNSSMVRVAIIGLGAATRNIHVPAYARLGSRVSIVAGCDVSEDARNMGLKCGIPTVFDDPREMIQKTAPDIVSVCTPPASHFEHTLLALHEGCHVFCEKPLTDSLDNADLLIREAERVGRQIVVNCQFPYMEIHLSAKKLIGSPEFGRLLFLQAWQTFQPTVTTESGWRGELKRRVGFEFGIHVFELIRFFFDDTPVSVAAQMPEILPAGASDLINIVTTQFADGRAASMVLNRISKGRERYLDMRLDGENASIRTSIGGRLEIKAGLHTRTRRPFLGVDVVAGGKATLENGTRTRVIAKDGMNPFASATARHFENFIDELWRGVPPRGSAADHKKTLALVFAAYDAAQSGRTVNVNRYLSTELHASFGRTESRNL